MKQKTRDRLAILVPMSVELSGVAGFLYFVFGYDDAALHIRLATGAVLFVACGKVAHWMHWYANLCVKHLIGRKWSRATQLLYSNPSRNQPEQALREAIALMNQVKFALTEVKSRTGADELRRLSNALPSAWVIRDKDGFDQIRYRRARVHSQRHTND